MGESRNDGVFSEAAASGNGGTAGAGEVVPIGAGDALDDAELAQAGEVSGEGCGGARVEQWHEIGASKAGDVEGGTLQGCKQGLFGVAEEIETFESAAVDGTRLSETVERADAGGEVVETGEVFEVAPVAAEQDVREGGKTIDVLFDRSEGVASEPLLRFVTDQRGRKVKSAGASQANCS